MNDLTTTGLVLIALLTIIAILRYSHERMVGKRKAKSASIDISRDGYGNVILCSLWDPGIWTRDLGVTCESCILNINCKIMEDSHD